MAKFKTKKKIIRKEKTIKFNDSNKKYFIISECYNENYNDLKTLSLRKYLQKYKLVEYLDIRNHDIELLKKHDIDLQKDKNCKNLLKLTRQTELLESLYIKNGKPIQFEFIWQNHIVKGVDKRLKNINANIKNIINSDKTQCIDNKSYLYKNMMKECKTIAEKHLALTFPINYYSKYDFDGIKHYILRPVNSFAGKDILYVSSRQELDDAIKYYHKTRNYKGIKYHNDVIASNYIINPLLFNGYKFHLRMYYLISYIDNIFNSFLLEEGDILTASQPYNTNKPFTKEIHDTHQKNSNDDYFFPKDLENEKNKKIDIENYVKQMRNIMKCASRILKNNNMKWLYPEQNNGFYIMGVDFMIDATTNNIILIEINTKPGFGYNNSENNVIFSEHFYKWVNETILEPTYKYKNQYFGRKHKTYLNI